MPFTPSRRAFATLALLGAMLCAPLLATPAAATPPAAAFCVIVIEGIDDFRIVRVAVDLTTNLTQRQALFAQLDTDKDGTVLPSEQEAFRAGTVQFWADPSRLAIRALGAEGGDLLGAWDALALHAVTWRKVGHTFHHQNYTQPTYVTQPVDLETQEIREVRFDQPRVPDTMVLRGGTDPTLPRPTQTSPSPTQTATVEYVVVRAPPGWRIDRIDGATYTGRFSIAVGSPEVDVPAFDTKSPYAITFSRLPPAPSETPTPTSTGTETTALGIPTSASREAPAAALAVGALLLGLAAFAVRRRL
ncbi:MAG: hypothetical protein QOG31_1895 [Thermoplasmata archaeon]|jgi:hypothetical protein|nr:hypothetical protein [Thermoplasmata archaeon]